MKSRLLIIFTTFFLWTFSYGQEYFILRDTMDRYGIIDNSGKTLIDFKYKSIIHKGNYIILTDNNSFKGLLSNKLIEILPCKYPNIRTCCNCNDWIVVESNKLYGYYDSTGNLMISHKFLDASLFKNDSALVWVKNEYEIKLVWIDRNGDIIGNENSIDYSNFNLNCIWVETKKVPEGLKKKGEYYGIYLNRKWIIAPKYDSIVCTDDDYYIVKKNNLVGLFDKQAKLIIPIIYKSIE